MLIRNILTLLIIISVQGTIGIAKCPISPEIINDYIDIAYIYQQNYQFSKAMEYLEMIEEYDRYNPKIIYQKAYLLKSLNRIDEAEKEIQKLISLNQYYACSKLAQSFQCKKHLCTANH